LSIDMTACFWHASTQIRGRIFVSARIRTGSRFKRFLCFVLINVRCFRVPSEVSSRYPAGTRTQVVYHAVGNALCPVRVSVKYECLQIRWKEAVLANGHSDSGIIRRAHQHILRRFGSKQFHHLWDWRICQSSNSKQFI
jgi:hypothetical protein